VPIERWNDFARLFDWEGTYLGAAVYSFFAQGGRKCYVIRVGDTWKPGTSRQERLGRLERLLPGVDEFVEASPVNRSTWAGAAHLFGLPDVSFLSMPDLAALLAVEAPPLPDPVSPPAGPEVFVECSKPATTPEKLHSREAAPRCDGDGYQRWSRFLERVKTLLSGHLREVQLVAAIPLPAPGTAVQDGTRTWFAEETPYPFLVAGDHLEPLQSTFVQLVYPWARTPGSAGLPEGLESPEGLLVGVLARSALLRGAFRSVMNQDLVEVLELFPVLDRGQLSTPHPDPETWRPARSMRERVSVLGPTATGLRVLSDVTTSPEEDWRQAGINRLMSVLVRACRRAGLEVVFEPSSERTWRELVYRLEAVLLQLWEVGALQGDSPRDAFQVRCDRTTMTQDDLDAGRLVAEVVFDAAQALESIRVVLTVSDGGAISAQAEGAS
jgi:hypothetical protein